METRIEKVPVIVNKPVQTGTIDKTIFVANDGKEFSREDECLKHESYLLAIEVGKSQFSDLSELGLTDKQFESVLRLCFGAYGSISNERAFIWTATKDENKIKEARNFLNANGFSNFVNFEVIAADNKDDKFIIADWIEDELSDYPTYKTVAVSVQKIINDFSELYAKILKLPVTNVNPKS